MPSRRFDAAAKTAEFRFYAPRVFVGVDIDNGGTVEATVAIHSPEIRELVCDQAGER